MTILNTATYVLLTLNECCVYKYITILFGSIINVSTFAMSKFFSQRHKNFSQMKTISQLQKQANKGPQ